MNQNTGRASIMAVAGGYLIYLAYQLLKSRIDQEATTMPLALSIVFIVLFFGIGGFLLYYAWKLWKEGREGKEEDRVMIQEEEEKESEETKTRNVGGEARGQVGEVGGETRGDNPSVQDKP